MGFISGPQTIYHPRGPRTLHGWEMKYYLSPDEGTVYGEKYYVVSPMNASAYWNDMMEWNIGIFGPSAKDGVWTPGMRWYANNSKFWFRNEADRTMFILRWA